MPLALPSEYFGNDELAFESAAGIVRLPMNLIQQGQWVHTPAVLPRRRLSADGQFCGRDNACRAQGDS